MQEKINNSDSHSLGICQRFFNFFNDLLAPTLSKRITLGHPSPQGSTQLRLDDSARKGVGSVGEHQPISSAKSGGVVNMQYGAYGNSSDILGSEAQVHFKHSDEELESWTPVGKDDAIVHGEQPQLRKRDKTFVSKKEIPPLQVNDISRSFKSKVREKTESSRGKSISQAAIEPKFTNKAPSTMVSLRDGADEEAKTKSKGKFIRRAEKISEDHQDKKKGKKIPSRKNLTLAMEGENSGANTIPSPNHFRPLLMPAPHNINEISEAFIKSKKEAMSKHLSVERS